MRHAATIGFLLATAVSVTLAQGTDKVYRTVGPDGRVTYSQTPPGQGTAARTLEFDRLPATPLPSYLLKFREDLAKGSAQAAAVPAGLSLFTAVWCGYCKQSRAWLQSAGVAYEEVDIEKPGGMAAFAAAGGKGGVPLLVGPKVRVQGYAPEAYAAALGAGRKP